MHSINSETNNLLIQEYLNNRPIVVPVGSLLRKYIHRYKKEFLASTTFFENILKPLFTSLLSSHLKKASDFAVEQKNRIPFIRKSTIFRSRRINYGGIDNIYGLLLEDEIYQRCEKLGNLDWHSLGRDDDMTVGAFLTAARRAMASNIGQPPIVISQHIKRNKFDFPFYYPMTQKTISNYTPEIIVYIGIPNMPCIYMMY
jgi:hypothetical protein